MNVISLVESGSIADQIQSGILSRGFHILSHDELEALWPNERLSGILRFQRIHNFAEKNGWEVAVKGLPSSALFQSKGQNVRSATTWRQSGAC
jgi:hypothetical protein